MVWNCSKRSVILVGLAVLAAALGLHSMSAGAAPPQQEPYPPPCPCTLVLVAADSVISPGECTQIICRVTDGSGSPTAGIECKLSILSQPGSGATVAPASAISDQKGETEAELCAGSSAGAIVVKGETECCQGQVQLTVQAPPVAAETLTPVAPPSTGSGTTGSSSWPIPLIAICAWCRGRSLLVWRTSVGRRRLLDPLTLGPASVAWLGPGGEEWWWH
jgi:hypothetical protein